VTKYLKDNIDELEEELDA